MEKRYVSNNGIEVFGYKNTNVHSFFISLFLRSGCMYEDRSENGITHFLEHILVRNVNRKMNSALYPLLDREGLEFNASTYAEMVQFYVSGASEKFSIGSKIIASLLSPLSLERNDVDLERKRIKAEIRESDEKNSLASFSNEKVHSGTSLSGSIIGTASTVNKISRGKLEEYRKSVFTDKNIFFYVTGNYTENDISQLLSEIEKYEIGKGNEHENFAPVPSNFGKREKEFYLKNEDYTVLRFSFDLDMTTVSVAETDILYDILFTGYSSRFFMEMSEKRGMFYDVSGALERYRNIGQLFFSFEIREAVLYDALEISVELLNRMKTEILPEEEIISAPYVDNAYMLFDDPREFNFTFAYDNHIMRLPYKALNDRVEAYRTVNGERIKEIADKIFRRENLVFSMKGKRKKVDTERINEILDKLG